MVGRFIHHFASCGPHLAAPVFCFVRLDETFRIAVMHNLPHPHEDGLALNEREEL